MKKNQPKTLYAQTEFTMINPKSIILMSFILFALFALIGIAFRHYPIIGA